MEEFIKLYGKLPAEKWQDPSNRYSLGELSSWIQSGKSIGWVIPDQLIVVDIDDSRVAERLLNNLSLLGTCGVFKTPRGIHLIYGSKGTQTIKNGSKVNVSLYIQVDYRVAGKGYIVYPTLEKDRSVLVPVPEKIDSLPDMLKPIAAKEPLDLCSIVSGSRNDTLYKHAIRLYNEKLKDVPGTLKAINQLLAAPLDEYELDLSLAQAKKFAEENPIKKVKKAKNDSDDVDELEVAQEAAEHFVFNHYNFYKYSEKYKMWERVNNTVVERFIYQLCSYSIKKAKLANIISKLKSLCYKELNPVKDLINTKSGAFNPETKELRPSEKTDYFTQYVNAEVSNVDTSELEELLGKMTPDLIGLKMMLGHVLHSNNAITEKAFMLKGTQSGMNGKDTFLTLVRNVFGFKQIEFNDLGGQFTLANLEDSMLLVDTDYNNRLITQSAIFKKIVSGSPVSAQVKFIQDEKEFISRATIVICTNLFPAVDASSAGGFFRRWVIIDFPNDFSNNRDPLIKLRMSSGYYNNQLFKMAIEGYDMLKQKRYKFPVGKSLAEWQGFNNPLGLWILSEYENGSGDSDRIPCSELYQHYKEYCFETGVKSPLTQSTFIRILCDTLPKCSKTRTRVSGKRVLVVTNIKLYNGD